MKTVFTRTFAAMLSLILLLTALPLQVLATSSAPPKDSTMYLVDLDQHTCSDVTGGAIGDVLRHVLRKGLPKGEAPSGAKLTGVLRSVYYMNKRQYISVYEIRPNELRINGEPYILNDEQSKLLATAYADTEKYTQYAEAFPMWTTWFGWNQVTNLDFLLNHKVSEYNSGGRYVATNKALKADPEAWHFVKEMFIYNTQVVPGSFKRETGAIKSTLGDYARCRMTLKNGTVYTIYFDSSGWIYIESNKQDYGCFYYHANPDIYTKLRISIAAGMIPTKYIEDTK